MENHDFTDWVEKHFIPFTCFKGHTCKDCPKSKGCFFEQKEERREVSKMSTNSILHNIVIEDKESAERLIDALEKSEVFSKKEKCWKKRGCLFNSNNSLKYMKCLHKNYFVQHCKADNDNKKGSDN